MDRLTARQAQILGFVRAHMQTNGAPPTRAEIAQAFGFKSANAAEDHLRALAKKGWIEVQEGTSRGIRLLETTSPWLAPEGVTQSPGPNYLALPLVGRVAAGNPMLADAHVERVYKLSRELFASRPDFLLRVRGWSMRDAGILDGDLLAVKAGVEPRDGQIVVARLESEVTVKRLRKTPDGVKLEPANPDFSVIPIHADEPWVIEGLVVGLWRDNGWG